MKVNFKLNLCYDGTKYKGWQKLGSTDNTVQGKVEGVLSRILDQNICLNASGRTDAGVHAKTQVCSFSADTSLSSDEILKDLRHYLPSDIGAISLSIADDRFHARYNCKGKTYLYRVWNSPEPNVFDRNFVYEFAQPLDISLMKDASRHFLGEHDFTSFTNAKHLKKSPVREIYSIDIVEADGEIRFFFTGNGFLQSMVRILVGTLLEIGSHQKKESDIPIIMEAKNRSFAGFTAPAKGLILEKIEY